MRTRKTRGREYRSNGTLIKPVGDFLPDPKGQSLRSCIPKVMLRPRKNLPWLTKQLIQATKKKKALFQKAKRTGHRIDYEIIYKRFHNKLTVMFRLSKQKYLNSLKLLDKKVFIKNKTFYQHMHFVRIMQEASWIYPINAIIVRSFLLYYVHYQSKRIEHHPAFEFLRNKVIHF